MIPRSALFLSLGLALCPGPSLPLESIGFRGPGRDGNFGGRIPHRQPRIAWTCTTGGPIRSSPIAVGDAVCFGSGDGMLYSVEAESGHERWHYRAGSALDGPACLAAGNLIAESRDGNLHAVDAASGAPKWKLALGPDAHSDWDYEFFVSGPVADGERVFVGSGHGEILCVDAQKGSVLWRHMTGGRVRASPSVFEGAVYCGSFDGYVYALDEKSGAELWKSATRGASIDCKAAGYDRRSVQSSTAVTQELVLVGCRDAHLYALDRGTGVERWSADHETSWVVSSPAVAGSTVVVGSSDGRFVQALELDSGKELWRHRTDSFSQPSPAIAGDVVVTGDGGSSIFALDLGSGRELWRVKTGEAVYSSPLVRQGRIYVGCDDGKLYALEGDLEARPRKALRAVYYDRTVPFRFFTGDRELYFALNDASYEWLSRQNVAAFLEARVADRAPSVVVFATDAVPASLLEESAGKPTLVRRYLDAGGKIVWPGFTPLTYTFDSATGQMVQPTLESLGRFRGVLGIDAAPPDEGSARAEPTELGRKWGLPAGWFMSAESIAVKPGEVELLATDEHGHASAWRKSFGGADGTGFVRCWGGQRPLPDPAVVLRMAEFGLD